MVFRPRTSSCQTAKKLICDTRQPQQIIAYQLCLKWYTSIVQVIIKTMLATEKPMMALELLATYISQLQCTLPFN